MASKRGASNRGAKERRDSSSSSSDGQERKRLRRYTSASDRGSSDSDPFESIYQPTRPQKRSSMAARSREAASGDSVSESSADRRSSGSEYEDEDVDASSGSDYAEADRAHRAASEVDDSDAAHEIARDGDSDNDTDSNSDAVSNRVAVSNRDARRTTVALHDEDEDNRATNGPIVEVLETPVLVPRMEKTSFASWSSFRQYLKSYSSQTYQILSVKSGNSVAARNATIRGSLKKKYGYKPAFLEKLLKDKLIPQQFEHYTKFVGCTHGGKPRIRSGDSDQPRVHQTHRGIGCPAKMNLSKQLTYAKASKLLDSIKTVETYAQGRVYAATKKKATALDEISVTLSDSVLGRVNAAVRRYRQKQPEGRGDVVVTLENGAYSSAALALMRVVNRVKGFRDLVETGLEWLATNPCRWATTLQWFRIPVDYKRTEKVMKTVDLSSPAAKLLSFCGKQHVDSDCIQAAMAVIQQRVRRRVIYLAPELTAIDGMHDDVLIGTPAIQELRAMNLLPAAESLSATESRSAIATLPVLVIALHFHDPDHWCGLLIDFATNMCTTFDPYQDPTRYARMNDWVRQYLIPIVPRFAEVRFHRQRFLSLLQRDSYNCGVMVLIFIELTLARIPGGQILEDELPDALKYMRYRYLWLTLEAARGSAEPTTEALLDN